MIYVGKRSARPTVVCRAGLMLAGVALVAGACAPKAITRAERLARANADLTEIFAKQEPVSKRIDVYEAMARALKYNLDRRVRAMEVAFASGEFNLAKFNLLPSVSGSVERNSRSNVSASSSRSILTGRQSLEPSTSQDRDRTIGDARIVWSALDFGVSYVRLKQEGNKVHIAREARRKVTNNLLYEVRRAYWREVAAQSVEKQLRQAVGSVRNAIWRIGSAQREGLITTRAAVDYRRRLSRTMLTATNVLQNLALARAQLASLMNLDPSTRFAVAAPRINAFKVPKVGIKVGKLRTIALMYRPELYEADYKDRIARLEKYTEILSALPGLRLEGAFNYDSNTFLNNNIWYEFGARLTVQLQRLVALPSRLDQVKARKALFALRRKTATLAVVTQVHLAHQAFHQKRRAYRLAREFYGNEWQNFSAVRAAERVTVAGRTDYVEAWANLLLARLNLLNAYADLQASYGRVLDSIGVDVAVPKDAKAGVEPLSAALRNWFRGGLGNRLRALSNEAEQALSRRVPDKRQAKN